MGSCNSSGKGNRGGKRANKRTSVKLNFYQDIDAENLTQTQIQEINLQRYNVFVDAFNYAKSNDVVSKPTLNPTQENLYYNLRDDGNYDILKNKSTKTLTKLQEQAQYDYDHTQRLLAKGDYDVRDDYVTHLMSGERLRRGESSHFTNAYKKRENASRIYREISLVLGKKL